MGRLINYGNFVTLLLFMTALLFYDTATELKQIKKLSTDYKNQLQACEYQFNMCKFLYKKGCE